MPGIGLSIQKLPETAISHHACLTVAAPEFLDHMIGEFNVSVGDVVLTNGVYSTNR